MTAADEPIPGRPGEASVYEALGGVPFFERLVARFYAEVAAYPVLLRLYPEPDLAPAQRRLALFLAQYWGGPTTYSEERGHPRLRARHFAFPIGPEERDHWLAAMRLALAETAGGTGIALDLTAPLERYFELAAEAMRNRE